LSWYTEMHIDSSLKVHLHVELTLREERWISLYVNTIYRFVMKVY
jgi:hypothetical protein